MLGAFTIGMPKAGRVVKILLLINLAVFIVQALVDRPTPLYPYGVISGWFGATVGGFWQIWRYFTFQFLHGDFLHIALNMLGLYMLGTPLEQRWGPKRFLRFYLSCGVVAGLAYVVMGAIVGMRADTPIVGASGGVYGIVLACAVLFPQFRLIFFLFPVPIRLAALIIFGGMGLLILQSVSHGVYSGQFWSDVAHLGGAVTAAVWIWIVPMFRGTLGRARRGARQGAWQRKLDRRAAEETEVDRILDKIRDQGVNSLTRKEKKILQDATHRQREEEQDLHRL